MIRHTILATSTAIIGLFFTIPALAQDGRGGQTVFNFTGGGMHQSETDLSDGDGAFAVDRWFFGMGLDYGWSQRDSIGFSVGAGKSIYEFSDLTSVGGGDPWGTIDDARVSVTWRFGFGDTGSVILIPTARVNGEKGASTGDSTTYGLFAAATWRINEDLTIGPGIGVFSRLEDGSRIFPILAIDWNITERLSLSTGRGLAASQGPGLTLGYQLNEDWSLGLAARYEDVEFRLDDESSTPDGVGRDQSIPLVFMGTLEPNKKLRFSVFAGIELNGTLKLKDSMGVAIEESDYDAAPIFGASFDVRF